MFVTRTQTYKETKCVKPTGLSAALFQPPLEALYAIFQPSPFLTPLSFSLPEDAERDEVPPRMDDIKGEAAEPHLGLTQRLVLCQGGPVDVEYGVLRVPWLYSLVVPYHGSNAVYGFVVLD